MYGYVLSGPLRTGGVVSRDGVDGIDGNDVVPPPVVSVVLLLLLPGVVVGGVVGVVGVVVVVVVDDDEDVVPPPVSAVPVVGVPVAVVVSVTCDDVTVGAGDVVMSTFTGVYAVCCRFNII
jgi:hypothetical protein